MLHVKFGATYSTLNRHPPDRPYRGAMALEDMVISAAHGLHNGARALGAMLGRASASPVAAELKSQDWFSVNALGRLLKRGGAAEPPPPPPVAAERVSTFTLLLLLLGAAMLIFERYRFGGSAPAPAPAPAPAATSPSGGAAKPRRRRSRSKEELPAAGSVVGVVGAYEGGPHMETEGFEIIGKPTD